MENEDKYSEIKREILGDSDDEDDSDAESGSEDEDDDEENGGIGVCRSRFPTSTEADSLSWPQLRTRRASPT